jgi:cell wall-associated NlpC family hydrolase
MSKFRLLVTALAVVAFVAAFQLQSAPPVAAATPTSSQAGAVLNFAASQLNKRFQMGANGLRRYDCSGLVYRTFEEEGLASKIGGQRTAAGYYNYFRRHGRVTHNPQKGDLVVWAHKGQRVSHIGIFDGYNRWGQPMAISALINPYGVTRHRVYGISVPLKAYLHVSISR